jgi:hypothetical protein
MQSYDENDRVLESTIVDEKQTMNKTLEKMLSNPSTNYVKIADFSEGETVELKGLQFKISSINQKAKRLTLVMK